MAIDSVQPGDIVARAIFDGRQVPLVAAGSSLSAYEIERLKSLGFQGVYVRGHTASSDNEGNIVSEEVRRVAVQRMADAMTMLRQGGALAVGPLQESVDQMLAEVLGVKTVLAGLSSLRTHDSYTFEHSVHVAAVSLMLGEELGLKPPRLRVLGLGALLHDVGKTSLSPTILRKPGRLTEEEYDNVKEHPREGYDILRAYKDLDASVADIAYQHHERMDGKGYPRQLRGRAIDRLARIVAVADVYDALTADRVYRKGMPTARVLDILKQDAGTAFDPEVVAAIQRRVARYPVGTVVRLNNGVIATVVSVPRDAPERPSVRAHADARGARLDAPITYNLRYDAILAIDEVLSV